MFGTLNRARAKLPLTPGERALLKLAQGFLVTGLVAALLTAGHALEGDGPVEWRRVLFASAVAALVAILNALAKYFTAQGDAPIGDALAYLAGEAQRLAGRNALKTPLTPPDTSDASNPMASAPLGE
jgi:hypothetical protein